MVETFKKHAPEVRAALTDVAALVTALGLTERAKRGHDGAWTVQCPHHGDRTPSCSVSHGPDGTIRVVCFGCQWKTDALGLIAEVRGYTLRDQEQFIEALAEGAEIAGHLQLADEIRGGNESPDRPRVEPPKPRPAPEYPPALEVADFWESLKPLNDDPIAAKYIDGRSISVSLTTKRDLARSVAFESARPTWAYCKGLPWLNTGHRIILRAYTADGAFRSVRSWQCDGRDYPKRLPPTGHRAQGLVLANALGVELLQGKTKPERVIIAEGEPDFLTAATRCKDTEAVFGIGSGFWTEEHAKRIPNGVPVAIVTDSDEAGDKYASGVIETLRNRCPVWRLNAAEGDLNDRAASKELPTDIWDACSPANDAAKDWDTKNPRVYNVTEMLQGSMTRAFSKEKSNALRTGHYRIDDWTGGIRPKFVWLLIGETSIGKTSFVISVADENMKDKARVLIVSFEDPESLFGDRLMQRRARVKASNLRDRRLTPEEMSSVTRVVNEAKPIPFFLDMIGVPIERAVVVMRNAIRKHKPDLVIVDYLQAIQSSERHEDERIKLTSIAAKLTAVIKSEGAAGIICSQLTPDDHKKTPDKYSARGTKDAPNAAEVVAVLFYQPEDFKDPDKGIEYTKGQRMLKIDKAKDGERGVVGLSWDENSACFDRVIRPLTREERVIKEIGFVADNDNEFDEPPKHWNTPSWYDPDA